MKVKGFMSDGNIFVTRKGIDKPDVLFHEYAHIYALKNADYEKLEETAREILSEEQIQKEIYGEIRYKSLIARKEAGDETAKQDFSVELFATAMGTFFNSVEDKLPSYNDFNEFQNNFANDLKKLASEDYSNEVYNIAKSLIGTQPKNGKYNIGDVVKIEENVFGIVKSFDGEKYEVENLYSGTIDNIIEKDIKENKVEKNTKKSKKSKK